MTLDDGAGAGTAASPVPGRAAGAGPGMSSGPAGQEPVMGTVPAFGEHTESIRAEFGR
jgi:hypothetical protein